MKSEVTDEMTLQELKGVIDNLMRYHSGALAKYACRAIDAALRLEAEMEDKVVDAGKEGYDEGHGDGLEEGRDLGYDDAVGEFNKEVEALQEELEEALWFCDQLYKERVEQHGSCGDALLTSFLRHHGRNV